jgi:hypothetical protein
MEFVEFKLWSNSSGARQSVFIDPSQVVSLRELDDRLDGSRGVVPCVEISLKNGQTFKIHDAARTARKFLEESLGKRLVEK